MQAILLAMVVIVGADLERGRDVRAGVWIGLAPALKLFLGLLLVYCLLRRRWRACLAGTALWLGLTAVSLLVIDAVDPSAAAQRWWSLYLAGWWLPHLGNQSIQGLVLRAGGSHALVHLTDLALCVLTMLALRVHGTPGVGTWLRK